jgi:hypothetical protein
MGRNYNSEPKKYGIIGTKKEKASKRSSTGPFRRLRGQGVIPCRSLFLPRVFAAIIPRRAKNQPTGG